MADGTFRNQVEDINQLKVRNNQGKMVPLEHAGRHSRHRRPVMVIRYNLYSAAPVNGDIYPHAQLRRGDRR